MPGYLLHDGAIAFCTHQGKLDPIVTSTRVKVGGQYIVTNASPHRVTGCPFVMGIVPSPCLTAQWMLFATRVRSEGNPVLLKDSQATCVPNGTPVLIQVTQTRVKGT